MDRVTLPTSAKPIRLYRRSPIWRVLNRHIEIPSAVVQHRSCGTTSDYCYLQHLFVHPAASGRGVGRTLIEHVCAQETKRGCQAKSFQALFHLDLNGRTELIGRAGYDG